MEFTREDWDFILHQDDPDFAQKFDALIRKYACRAYEDKSNFPTGELLAIFITGPHLITGCVR